MKLFILVTAHGRAQVTFDRHLPFWLAHNPDELIICSPANDIVKAKGFWQLPAFEASHHGPESYKRLMFGLRHAFDCGADFYVLFEYDSLCLEPRLDFLPGFQCIVQRNPGDREYATDTWPNFPVIMDHDTLGVLLGMARKFPDLQENGYQDRIMGALAAKAGIQLVEHQPKGYSHNTILPDHLAEFQAALLTGATMIHGIKDRLTLNWALHWHQFYQNNS